MGQNNSRTYNDSNFIPSERLFKLSYTVSKKFNLTLSEYHNTSVNISKVFDYYNDFRGKNYNKMSVFMQFLYFLTRNIGYTLKPTNIEWGYMSIEGILHQINLKGFPAINNEFIKDIKIVKCCYKPDLNAIYYFLNKGEPLLAMVMLDLEFVTECLKISIETINDIGTDAVIIVGYDPDNFYIKTNWFDFDIKVENRFIDNIKELWNVKMQNLNLN